jgi:signal transduction histidine kinase
MDHLLVGCDEARNPVQCRLRCRQANPTGGLPPAQRGARSLDAARPITDNFRNATTRRSITLEGGHAEAQRETIDRLRNEVDELRASRARLVIGADADRRTIERGLHDGLQQRLVALAASLELGRRTGDGDPEAMKSLLVELGGDVQEALDEAAKLAHRIYPPLLDAGGLAAALRTAAATLGVPTRVEVGGAAAYPVEVAATVYFCCVEALEQAGTAATVHVQADGDMLSFEVVADGAPVDLNSLRDRVEALGGSLTTGPDPSGGVRISGALPLSR